MSTLFGVSRCANSYVFGICTGLPRHEVFLTATIHREAVEIIERILILSSLYFAESTCHFPHTLPHNTSRTPEVRGNITTCLRSVYRKYRSKGVILF